MIKLIESSKGVILKIRVSPGRNAFKVKGFDTWSNSLLLDTKAPAEQGKANREIEEELGKLLGKKTEIKSGIHSRNKTVLVHGKSQEVRSALEQLAD